MAFEVALVSNDDEVRLELVRAFDSAPRAWGLSLHRDAPERADVVVCGPDVDLEGAVRFDPSHAHGVLEEVKSRLRSATPVIGVTSANGGIGVTTLALHLAAEFAARGSLTGLVDLDPVWGIGTRLGLDPDDTRPGANCRIVPLAGGFRLYVRGVDEDPAAAVTAAADRFDRVVVDAPHHALNDVVTAGWSRGLLLAAASPDGARRASAVLEAHPRVSWVVVVNRVGPGGETTAHRIGRILGSPVVELPCCPGLRDAEDDGRLLRRGLTRWSRRVGRLATFLAR